MPQDTHSHRPNFSEKQAAEMARSHFDLHIEEMKELPSDRDRNYYLRTPDGAEFTLKIANADSEKDVLDLQNAAIARVGIQLDAHACPRICRARSGEIMTSVPDTADVPHFVRLLSYVPGVPLAKYRPHTPDFLQQYGEFLGNLSRALDGFQHPAGSRYLKWDIQHAPSVIRQHLDDIALPEHRKIVTALLEQAESGISAWLPQLRTSIVHNDANDYNVLVNWHEPDEQSFAIIDFGDIVASYTVCELAIAVAYAILDKSDPIAAATQVVRGYHKTFALTEPEVHTLFHFVCLRLCLSVSMSAYQQKLEPNNRYLTISEKPAWAALEKLRSVHPQFATAMFRHACGWPPTPGAERIMDWLKNNVHEFSPILQSMPASHRIHVFDLSIDNSEFADQQGGYQPEPFTARLFEILREKHAEIGIGRYNEARRFYASDAFKTSADAHAEWRTIHIGIDLFAEAGTVIHAPLDGTVHSFRDNAAPFDYGPAIILEHRRENEHIVFYTLYGHLSRDSLDGLTPGMPIQKGQAIAKLGDLDVNGGWPPHLHFQIMHDVFDAQGDFPGVAPASQCSFWLELCPDPNLIMGLPQDIFPPEKWDQPTLLTQRSKHLGKSLSISYKKPLTMVRGAMQYLFDDTGRRYLDAVNNVPHVGHCHPHVVAAGQRQMRVLNTNTRYLHELILRYAERLCAKMPDPLSVCFLVNSGSEANELALRMAQTFTKAKNLIVIDHAYHGNTGAAISVSPYKFNGKGGAGKPEHVHIAAMPDRFRGRFRRRDAQAGQKYAEQAIDLIQKTSARGDKIAAFIGESLLSCGGQIVLPPDYLSQVYAAIRKAGGVCIADEVQVGFGRVGSHFWAFETQYVVPDIVTLGKPIGNGHPLGAVITTPEIANAFHNGMEYFNTFGGNAVSCAIGMAVLDVLENDGLQQHALEVGGYLQNALRELQSKHRLIGDVRGLGLFIGVELVRDGDTLEPAKAEASYIANRMKDAGILLSTDGPDENVLKIKPPMPFNIENADFLIMALGDILQENKLQ